MCAKTTTVHHCSNSPQPTNKETNNQQPQPQQQQQQQQQQQTTKTTKTNNQQQKQITSNRQTTNNMPSPFLRFLRSGQTLSSSTAHNTTNFDLRPIFQLLPNLFPPFGRGSAWIQVSRNIVQNHAACPTRHSCAVPI